MRTLLYLYILTRVLRKADSGQRWNDLSVETQGGGVGWWVERDRRQSEGDVALCWQLLYISGEEGAAHRAVPALLPSIRYCKKKLHCGVVRRGDFSICTPSSSVILHWSRHTPQNNSQVLTRCIFCPLGVGKAKDGEVETLFGMVRCLPPRKREVAMGSKKVHEVCAQCLTQAWQPSTRTLALSSKPKAS